MKRTLLVALFFCAAGCKKDEGPSPEAVDQAASLKPLAVVVPVDAGAPPVANAAADVDSDRDASEDVAAEPDPRKAAPKSPPHALTEEDIQKFILWRKKIDELGQAAQKEFKTRTAAIQKAGGLQQQLELNRAVQELGAKKVQADQLALQAAGLDAATAEWLRSIVWDVMGNRMLAEESGLEATVAQAEASMKTMKPEEKAHAQAELDKLKVTLKSLVSLRDTREEYGDANVQLLLKHEAELMPLYKRAVQSMGATQ